MTNPEPFGRGKSLKESAPELSAQAPGKMTEATTISDLPAQAFGDRGKPVAIVDIGSNSVRLVAYEGLSRAPTPIFNEKAMCAPRQGRRRPPADWPRMASTRR